MKVRVPKEQIYKKIRYHSIDFETVPDFIELEGEMVEEINGACVLDRHDKCADTKRCSCDCHLECPMTLGEAELAAGLNKALEDNLPPLPEMVGGKSGTLIEDAIREMAQAINNIIRYLKAREK